MFCVHASFTINLGKKLIYLYSRHINQTEFAIGFLGFLGEMDWPHSTSSSLASIDTGISSNYSNNNNNPIRFTLNDESYSDQSLNEDYDEHFEYQKKFYTIQIIVYIIA